MGPLFVNAAARAVTIHQHLVRAGIDRENHDRGIDPVRVELARSGGPAGTNRWHPCELGRVCLMRVAR